MQELFRILEKTYLPTAYPHCDEFQEILKEYRYALLVKFISPAITQLNLIEKEI
jgi:predicted metal-binding protein